MYRSSLLFYIVYLCAICSLHAQYGASTDSLKSHLATLEVTDTNHIRTLVDLWRASSSNDLESAEQYAREIIQKSAAISYTKGIATGYQRLGITQSQAGEIDSSMVNYHKALDIYNDLEWPGLQGVMLYNIGGNFLNAAQYDSAYSYYALAADRFAIDKNPKRQGAVLLSLSRIDREQHRYDRSLEQALQARSLFIEAQDSIWLADAETEIGFANMELEDYTAAMASFVEAADIFAKFQDDYYRQIARINQATLFNLMEEPQRSIDLLDSIISETAEAGFAPLQIEALGVLSIIEKEQGLNDQSIRHFDQLLAITDPVDDLDARLQALAFASDLLAEMGQLNKAESYANLALEPALKRELLLLASFAQRALVKVAESRGNYPKAIEYREQYDELKDSLRQRENLDRLAIIEARFQTKEQQLEIDRKSAELIALEQEQQVARLRQRSWIFGLAVMVLLVGLIAYSLWQRNGRIQSEQKAEKLRLQNQLDEQQKKLSVHTLHLLQKNQTLEELRIQLEQMQTRSNDRPSIERMIRDLQSEKRTEQDWQSFKVYFEQVHGSFERSLQLATTEGKLSQRELRLAALIKVGLNNNELTEMLRISQDSLYKAKYRLKKKLPVGENQSLEGFLKDM
ncbi:MAG: hypothetical protein AAF741_16245 [Bacteroidota bacterium]